MRHDAFVRRPRDAIDDLRFRPDRTRLVPVPAGVEDGGVDPSRLRDLITIWRESFSWEAQEDRLGALR